MAAPLRGRGPCFVLVERTTHRIFRTSYYSDLLSLLGELGAGAWAGITSGERAKGARPIRISRVLVLKLHFHQRRSWTGLSRRSIAPSLACDSAPRSGLRRRGKGRDFGQAPGGSPCEILFGGYFTVAKKYQE